MNNTIKELLDRKSVRVYEDKEIPKEAREQILLSAINAPTAGNMQLYSIIDIKDKDKLEKLSVICDNQKFIKDAKMCLIFLADSTRWYKLYKQIEPNDLEPTIADYFWSFADAMCAAQNAVTAAQSLGIGSCYIGDICEYFEETKKMLNLPKHVLPVGMLVFGYPTQEQIDRPKPVRLRVEDVVFEDSYNDQTDDEIFNAIANKIMVGKDITLEEAKRKATQYISILYKKKQDAPFFIEMNRSLKVMLKDYFK